MSIILTDDVFNLPLAMRKFTGIMRKLTYTFARHLQKMCISTVLIIFLSRKKAIQ